MTARFVLDESSWNSATGENSDVLTEATDLLLERLDTARERNEVVAKHKDFIQNSLGNNVHLYSALYEPDCVVQFERDQAEQLAYAIDAAVDFDDSELNQEYHVEFGEQFRFAPGFSWAHARCSQGRQVAVLPLALEGVPRSLVPVSVRGSNAEIFFVTDECGHVGFFRRAIALENADRNMFQQLAGSAFPALEWADGVWNGLGEFSRSYLDVRSDLVRSLGGLNDHGAACFHNSLYGDQSQLSNR